MQKVTADTLPTMTADEILAIREALELSQREMGAMLGVGLRSYQRWEYGERDIPGPAVLLARRIAAEKK
jgi:DNA-binding transcriptional regulator YiaG